MTKPQADVYNIRICYENGASIFHNGRGTSLRLPARKTTPRAHVWSGNTWPSSGIMDISQLFHPSQTGQGTSGFSLELKAQGRLSRLAYIHAAKLASTHHKAELGALSLDQQKEVPALGAEMFGRYFRFRPNLFRPGCFSANDHTYKALLETGFKGCSICIPGT